MAEYIDKKALITEIQSAVSMVLQTAPYEKVWFDRFVDRQNEIMAIIERQPAAEVEPVRHGQFFRTGRIISCDSAIEIQCSECEETHLVDAIRLETATRYCPYCGAKWTGGADNG